MDKITFKVQLLIGLIVIALGVICTMIFKESVITNVAICLYGAMFIINPVQPDSAEKSAYGRGKVRILGALIVIFGVLIRFGV